MKTFYSHETAKFSAVMFKLKLISREEVFNNFFRNPNKISPHEERLMGYFLTTAQSEKSPKFRSTFHKLKSLLKLTL